MSFTTFTFCAEIAWSILVLAILAASIRKETQR